MCGIVGLVTKAGGVVDIAAFHRLMEESRIRGQHAHGYAYVNGDEVIIHKTPGPYVTMAEVETNAIIGHCRYSTSDLLFNQPIGDATAAIVHNGVITQEEPGAWQQKFGVVCEGRNDTEILFQLARSGVEPLSVGGSQAASLLTNESVSIWRNEYRPLYYADYNGDLAFASTANILHRALGITRVRECRAGDRLEFVFRSGTLIEHRGLGSLKEDMQHAKV